MDYEVKVGTLCNNNCVFCLNEERFSSPSTEAVLAEIDAAVGRGVDCIHFTGGEVSLRRDFFQLVRYVKAKGLRLGVQTNGRAFSYGDICDAISSFGQHQFLISLHAHNESLYEKITRVKGGYSQVIKGIRNLKMRGHRISINVVVNSLNFNFLEEIAEHHSSLGADVIQFSWARPMGRAEKDVKGIIPRYQDGSDSLAAALELLEAKGVIVGVIGVPPCVLPGYFHLIIDAYEDAVVLREDGVSPAVKVFAEKRKMKIGSCSFCALDKQCDGFFKGYAREHGTSEFMPIKGL